MGAPGAIDLANKSAFENLGEIAKFAGGDAELRAAIEAKLGGQTGSAADQKLVKKMMAEFREGLDKLKDPQDRAFYLASRDEWIAEFLERSGKEIPIPQGKPADKKMTERVIKAAPKVKNGEIK